MCIGTRRHSVMRIGLFMLQERSIYCCVKRSQFFFTRYQVRLDSSREGRKFFSGEFFAGGTGWNLFLSFCGVLLCLRVARGAGGAPQMCTAQSVRGASTCVISTTHARGNHAGSKTSSCRPLMSLLRALATWWRRCGMDMRCGGEISTF